MQGIDANEFGLVAMEEGQEEDLVSASKFIG